MLELSKHIGTGFGKGELYDVLTELQLFCGGVNQGEVYFVEGNAGDDGYDGSSWDKAFKTLAKAIAISNANIAAGSSGWAARNTIFCKGDSLTEDLTTGPSKCDVIGVGSCKHIPHCRLVGEHVITTSSTMGCRWINMEFYNDDASAIFTYTGGGFEFHNCVFRANSDSVSAIVTSAPHDVKICNCEFLEDSEGDAFDTVAIAITGGAYNCQIRNNFITGDLGITIGAGNYYHCLIDRNVFHTVGMCINDAAEDWLMTNNQLMASVNTGTVTNIVTGSAYLACNNICTGTTGGASISYPVIT